MSKVQLYDTTLRDGMQGFGMSLSAAEKVRVVHALDALGIGMIEAGFPGSNPKELELFEMLASEELEQATICAFGMTRRRGVAAAEDPGLTVLADCFTPAVCLVGKTWGLHLEVVTKVSRDENLAMIGESVAFCVESGKRVVYDAEHFFDGWRDDSGYALACLRAALDAGAENVTLCDTNGSSLPHQIGQAVTRVVTELGPDVSVGIHTHNDAECGVANSLAGVQAGADLVQGTVNGFGERTGNANLISILPALQLKLGYDCVEPDRLARLTETAHLIDEICNLTPDPDQPYVGRNAFAHKGGLHAAAVSADARTFEHMEPEVVGNSREVLISELAGKGSVASRAERAGIELDDDGARRAIDEIKRREHLGYHYEAADASFELLLRHEAGSYESLFTLESFRVITEKRADGRVETEATIKLWIGDTRYIRTAEGDGPVHALDRALRSAITEQHPEIAEVELTNFKVRILDEDHGTGAITRVLLDSSDGHDSWGSIGVSANVIEASWEALVDSLEYAFQPKPNRARRIGGGGLSEARIPLARPVLGEREEELVLEVLRSGMLSLGPKLGEFERAFAARIGVEDAVAVSSGTTALHLAVRELGWGPGDEVLTTPLSFIASSNCLLFEDARPVFCDVDPATLTLDPAAAEAAVGEATAGVLPVHIFGFPAAIAEFEALAEARGLGIVEDAAQALGAIDAEGREAGSRGNPSAFAFYANKQMTTGEGGMLVPGSAAAAAVARSERNQGRAPGMKVMAHERIGFNYRLTDVQAALGIAQLERLDQMLADRARVAGWYDERFAALDGAEPGAGDPDGLVLPLADRGAERRSWFVYIVRLPAGVDRDAVIEALDGDGIDARPYLPCIHLFDPYRERFGYAEGDFPVAEEFSRRALALPFYPALPEESVERVVESLGRALGAARALARRSTSSSA